MDVWIRRRRRTRAELAAKEGLNQWVRHHRFERIWPGFRCRGSIEEDRERRRFRWSSIGDWQDLKLAKGRNSAGFESYVKPIEDASEVESD